MRIYFACTFNFPESGPAARAVYLQAKGLAERGHEVSIIVCRGAWKSGNSINYNGVKVHCFQPINVRPTFIPGKLLWVFSQIWILYKLCILTILSRYDRIIFYGAAPVFAPIVILSKLFNRKSAFIQYDLVTTEYTQTLISYIYRRLFLLSEKLLASYSTLQITGCSSVLKARLSKIGNATKQLCLWPPTDINFSASGKGESVRASYDLRDKKVIVYTGSLTNLEGVHILIDAMTKVIKGYSSAVLLLVGANQSIDAAYNGKMDYRQLVSDLMISESVIFTGLVDMAKVPDYLAAADVLVMPKIDHPANHMASPIKIGEYLASGKPIVSSNICELDTWLTDRFDILFCKPNDSNDLAEKICEVFDNVELANLMAKNGVEAAKQNCDYHVWAHQVENYLNDL